MTAAMKTTATYMLTLAVALALCMPLGAQEQTVSTVTECLAKGQITLLSEHLAPEAEVTVQEKCFSGKDRSCRALEKFLTENAPARFDVIHQGAKESSVFVIGNLHTGSQSIFRVYFLVKDNRIQQMRIEKND